MEEFVQIISMCKSSVHLTVNEDTSEYKSTEQFLDDYAAFNEDYANIPADVRSEMIARKMVIHLQFYPDTSIGSYSVIHYDLAFVLREGLRILKELRGVK